MPPGTFNIKLWVWLGPGACNIELWARLLNECPKFSQGALFLRFELYLWGSSLEIYPSGTGLELYLWGSCLKPYPWGAPLELYPWRYPWGSSLELYSWGSRLELYLWGSSLELYSWGSRLELYPWGSSLDYTPEAPVWSLSSLSELSERTFWHLVKSSQYTFFTSFASSWKSLVGLFSLLKPSEIFSNLRTTSQDLLKYCSEISLKQIAFWSS